MATTYTENYHLGKQNNINDLFQMSVITGNMDIIDSLIKSANDAISATASTVEGHTTSIETLDSAVGGLTTDVGGLTASVDDLATSVSGLSSSLSSLTNKVNKYAVPQTKETASGIIEDDDITGFADGALVGKFAESIWDLTQQQSTDWQWGVLFAYTMGDEGMGRHVTQFLWIPSASPTYPNGLMLTRDGYLPLGNFRYCWSPDVYEKSISSSSLENMRHGTWIGTVSTDITGAASAMRGIARAYSYSNSMSYDLHSYGHCCMQVVETIDGTRKTRYYDNDSISGGWSAWV